MKRYFYISDNLDDIQKVEADLEADGFEKSHMHVVSNQEATVDKKHLNGVSSLFKKDVVWSPLKGAGIGLVIAAIILGSAYLMNVSAEYWILASFASVIAFGFCTWEGGMWGLHKTNREFERYNKYIDNGNHLFFVDVEEAKKGRLEKTLSKYTHLQLMDVKASSWVPAF